MKVPVRMPAGGILRALSLAFLLLLLPPNLAAAADKNAELQALYNALNMLNQQQQSIYQQFQMLQDLRRNGFVPRYGTPMLPQFPQFMGPPANYDDVVAAQKNALQRDENLSQQADQLLDRYNEIEDMKKPLQQKIYSLTLGK